MKKRDEGYVLVFVLVVIVVLCIVSASMLSVSLRNLNAQTESIEHMQDKYEAQGMMEAEISSIDWNILLSADTGKEEAIKNQLAEYNVLTELSSIKILAGSESTDLDAELTLTVQPEGSSFKINADIQWTADITAEGSNYQVSNSKVVCTSYEIVEVS